MYNYPTTGIRNALMMTPTGQQAIQRYQFGGQTTVGGHPTDQSLAQILSGGTFYHPTTYEKKEADIANLLGTTPAEDPYLKRKKIIPRDERIENDPTEIIPKGSLYSLEGPEATQDVIGMEGTPLTQYEDFDIDFGDVLSGVASISPIHWAGKVGSTILNLGRKLVGRGEGEDVPITKQDNTISPNLPSSVYNLEGQFGLPPQPPSLINPEEDARPIGVAEGISSLEPLVGASGIPYDPTGMSTGEFGRPTLVPSQAPVEAPISDPKAVVSSPAPSPQSEGTRKRTEVYLSEDQARPWLGQRSQQEFLNLPQKVQDRIRADHQPEVKRAQENYISSHVPTMDVEDILEKQGVDVTETVEDTALTESDLAVPTKAAAPLSIPAITPPDTAVFSNPNLQRAFVALVEGGMSKDRAMAVVQSHINLGNQIYDSDLSNVDNIREIVARQPGGNPKIVLPTHITGDPSGGGGLAAFAPTTPGKFGVEAGLLGHGIGGGGYDDAADYGGPGMGGDIGDPGSEGFGW
jgi:hypothetical protein